MGELRPNYLLPAVGAEVDIVVMKLPKTTTTFIKAYKIYSRRLPSFLNFGDDERNVVAIVATRAVTMLRTVWIYVIRLYIPPVRIGHRSVKRATV